MFCRKTNKRCIWRIPRKTQFSTYPCAAACQVVTPALFCRLEIQFNGHRHHVLTVNSKSKPRQMWQCCGCFCVHVCVAANTRNTCHNFRTWVWSCRFTTSTGLRCCARQSVCSTDRRKTSFMKSYSLTTSVQKVASPAACYMLVVVFFRIVFVSCQCCFSGI